MHDDNPGGMHMESMTTLGWEEFGRMGTKNFKGDGGKSHSAYIIHRQRLNLLLMEGGRMAAYTGCERKNGFTKSVSRCHSTVSCGDRIFPE